MPKIKVLAHPQLCPQGCEFEAKEGTMLAKALLQAGVAVPHACEFSGACATCHVIVEEGLDSLSEMDDLESDRLDNAWGVTEKSRLSCRAYIGKEDLVIRIPKYNRNHVG